MQIINNFQELEKALVQAKNIPNANEKEEILIASPIVLQNNLSEINNSGYDLSIPEQWIIRFDNSNPIVTPTIDLGSNIVEISEKNIVRGENNEIVFITDAYYPDGSCIILRSNGPLPLTSSGNRLVREKPYYIKNTDIGFCISESLDGDAITTDVDPNLVDISIYRAFGASDIANQNGFFVFNIKGHNVKEGQRIYLWKNENYSKLPTNIRGGMSLSETSRFYAINVQPDSFEITTSPGSLSKRVKYSSGAYGAGMTYVTTFDLQINGVIQSDFQCFKNFITGYESLYSKDTVGLPSVFGSFGGEARNMVWWTGRPQQKMNYIFSNALGLSKTTWGSSIASTNPRYKDLTNGVRACVNSGNRLRGERGTGGGFNDSNRFYKSTYVNTPIITPGGIYRITDQILFNRCHCVRIVGSGENNTVFVGDLWKDNNTTKFYTGQTEGPQYSVFNFKEVTYGAGVIDCTILGSTRLPSNSAMIHISGGGGAENMIFTNLHIYLYKKYAICMGPGPVNHPRYTDIYIQNACHPASSAVATLGNILCKFKISGSTINSGQATACNVYRAFDLDAPTEAIIESFHFEQYGVPIDIGSSSSILEMRGLDGIAHQRNLLLENLGDKYVNIYYLAGYKFGISKLNLNVIELLSEHEFKPEDKIAIFGGVGTGIYTCGPGTTGKTIILKESSLPQFSGAEKICGMAFANCHIGNKTSIIFHSVSSGTKNEYLTDRPLFLYNHYYKDFSAFDIDIKNNTIDIGINNFVDGDMVYFVPPLAGANIKNNFFVPRGVDANKHCFVKKIGNSSVRLFKDRALLDPVIIETESSVAGNGTIGDESWYTLWGAKAKVYLKISDFSSSSNAISIGNEKFYYCNMISPVVLTSDSNKARYDTGYIAVQRTTYKGDKENGYVVSPAVLYGETGTVLMEPANEILRNTNGSVSRIQK